MREAVPMAMALPVGQPRSMCRRAGSHVPTVTLGGVPEGGALLAGSPGMGALESHWPLPQHQPFMLQIDAGW